MLCLTFIRFLLIPLRKSSSDGKSVAQSHEAPIECCTAEREEIAPRLFALCQPICDDVLMSEEGAKAGQEEETVAQKLQLVL
jgi:hypothetical protein